MEFPNLQQFRKIAYDTETTGLQYPIDKAFGFSVSTPDGKDYYYDIRETPSAVDWANDSLRVYNGLVVCHNASFDYRMSSASNIYLPLDQLDDTVIRAAQINEFEKPDRHGNNAYSLEQLCLKYLGEGKYGNIYEELAAIFGGPATRKVQIGNLQYAPPETVAPYAKMDTRRTLELHDWQDEEIVRQGIQRIVAFELDIMPTFIRSEMRGIDVDEEYAHRAALKLSPIITDLQLRVNKLAGFDLNVNSPKQKRELFKPEKIRDGLWEASDGTPLNETGSGVASIDAEALRQMTHPAAPLIVELMSTIKTRDTFLKKHVLGHIINGKVYPTISQTKTEVGGAGTGRVQYSDPAMGQIPSRNKAVAAIVKPCFVPPEGMVWCSCDKNSFEVRVFADLINNPQINEEYRKNPLTDFHQFVGDISHLPRNATYSGEPNAKQLNLSMIFNSGDGAIAAKMGMPFEWTKFLPRGKIDKPENWVHYRKPGREAMDVIERYHMRVGGVKQLAEREAEKARKNGYIETYFGRRFRFPNLRFAYKASGIRIQATAADLNKENWKIIEDELGDSGHLILNTHDSYELALPEDWEPHYNKVKRGIELEGRLNVPLILDWSGTGRNWWEALQGEDRAKLSNTTKRTIAK